MAVRMNPAEFASLPASACTLDTTGPYGPDRVVQTTYDDVGRPLTTTSALGTGAAVTEAVGYTANGRVGSLTDGQGNVSVMEYDGFDRLAKLRYPNATGGGTSTTDYEQYAFDLYGRPYSSRDRAGSLTYFGFDGLNRLVAVNYPSGTPDVSSGYDNLGRMTSTGDGAISVSNAYDALSRLVSQGQTGVGTMAYQYDAAGRMTRITWPDAVYVAYDHDLYGAVTAVRLNGATSGTGVLATYGWTSLGQPASVARADGTAVSTTYGYDAFGRLTSLAHDASGGSNDVTLGFGYNPAGQITGRTVSNDAYVWTPTTAGTNYTNNGLNQVTAVGGSAVGYDGNENATSIPGATYGYDAANRLTSASAGLGATAYAFDPAGRLATSATGGATTRFQYAGVQLVAEYDGSGTLTNRYVPGLGIDNVVTAYAGSGTGSPSWLLADELGSVTALAGSGGVVTAVNRYDEYGVPASGNAGRFQYTGQAWLAEAGAYHYRARTYLQSVGRFGQEDPLGYAAGQNLYAYVGGDPVNLADPMGLDRCTVYRRTRVIDNETRRVLSTTFDAITLECGAFQPREVAAWMTEIFGGNFGVSSTCNAGVHEARKDVAALNRAIGAWATLSRAGNAFQLDASILAGIGIRESGFQNVDQVGGGYGRGVFQIDISRNPSVTAAQARDLNWSARWVASRVSSNLSYMQSTYPNLSSDEHMQAALAAYNFGRGNISGNPATIDVGTSGNNYGGNVLRIASCFR